MSKQSSIIYEGLLVALGRESPSKFFISVILFVIGDTLLTKEVLSMDLIYIPADYQLVVVIIMAVLSIFGPIVSGLFMKGESKHKFDEWESKYTASMIIDMLLTPSISIIVYSIIIQKWIPDIDAVAYIILLPILMLAVSFYTLKGLNEGAKALVEGIRNLKGDIEQINELK